MSSDGAPETGSPLNGWKEIAAYVGKSVRAVQRWERDHSLPVHRIKTEAGQVVYAHRHELDAWRVSTQPTAAPLDVEDVPAAEAPGSAQHEDGAASGSAAGEGDHAPAHVTSHAEPSWRRRWLILAAVVLCAGAGFGLRYWTQDQSLANRTLRGLHVEGNTVVGVAEGDVPLWRYPLESTPGSPGSSLAVSTVSTIADIDGDGSPEGLIVARKPGLSGQPGNEAIFCFSADGTLRWTYSPPHTWSFGGRPFGPPWKLLAMTASTTGDRQRVFVAYGGQHTSPSFVLELTADGQAGLKYVQGGAIQCLRQWTVATGSYVIAGGTAAGYKQASVAIVDVNAPATRAPQKNVAPEFRCDGCPDAGPVLFALLPHTELVDVSGIPFNRIMELSLAGQDLRIQTLEDLRSLGGGVVYTLRKDFTFDDAAFDDLYWSHHGKLEREKAVDHAASHCPEPGRRHAVRTWRPGAGWTDVNMTFKNAR